MSDLKHREVQRNLLEKRYKDGLLEGWVWGLIFGSLAGCAVTFLIITFI